jgi:transposase
MTHLVGLDVSQEMTAICVVDSYGRRLWPDQCITEPEHVKQHGGADVRIGLEAGPMTPCLCMKCAASGSMSPAWMAAVRERRSR